MDQPTCPKCGGGKFVTGGCTSGEGFSRAFVPGETRHLGFFRSVPIRMGFGACLDCGHLWGEVDPAALRSFIEKHGTELARQNLDRLDGRWPAGLPDNSAAREVAGRVAALDHLILSGLPTAVANRYREYTGATWPEAIAATRNWKKLPLTEKLARLGWTNGKAKVPADDLAEPLL